MHVGECRECFDFGFVDHLSNLFVLSKGFNTAAQHHRRETRVEEIHHERWNSIRIRLDRGPFPTAIGLAHRHLGLPRAGLAGVPICRVVRATPAAEGFEVEEGSGGMPTAFCAMWGTSGPTIGGYAEYDAVPGNSQERVPYEKPREGVHRWAAGHTDPHSALGLGALGGFLAAKAAIEEHRLEGRLKFMGEPAEKVCGSKPVHAAKGYYDDMSAAVSFHPSYGVMRANTTVLDTHCGSYWSRIYTFECVSPETWSDMTAGRGSAHTMARAPGANDALCLMYTTTKYTKEAMLPHTGTWTLNEAILGGGNATSDNLPPRFAQIQYSWRSANPGDAGTHCASARQQRRSRRGD